MAQATAKPVSAHAQAQIGALELGLKIPPILFEGDEPVASPEGDANRKYAVAPQSPKDMVQFESPDLPESYGTGRLSLTARDPRSLYAHWDIAPDQQQHLSAQAHLVVRIHAGDRAGAKVQELAVPAASRSWFLPAAQAGSSYAVEVGYYAPDQIWKRLAISESARTPPERYAADGRVQFVTLPLEQPRTRAELDPTPPNPAPEATVQRPATPPASLIPAAQPVELPRVFAPLYRTEPPGVPLPLVSAAVDLGIEPAAGPPFAFESAGPPAPDAGWTPAREQALGEFIGSEAPRTEHAGSAEMVEILRRAAAPPAGAGGPPTSPSGPVEIQATSSLAGGERPVPAGFWLKVNAELVIYGATEPNARVTMGGRLIQLREDGTFSYRFALPDGRYELDIQAESVTDDVRRARLLFQRATTCEGQVGAHPQEAALKAPLPENIL